MAMVLGMVLSGALVLTVSRAAFTAQTENSDNSLEAGDVTLTDDDAGSAMFTVTNMAPDDPAVVRCIEVTYAGSITDPGEVRLYSGGFTPTGTLANELQITVDVGTGSTTGLGDCSSFSLVANVFGPDTLANFDSSHDSYLNGASGWDPSSTPETRVFRFAIDLPSSATDAVQGDAVNDLVFTWEVQS